MRVKQKDKTNIIHKYSFCKYTVATILAFAVFVVTLLLSCQNSSCETVDPKNNFLNSAAKHKEALNYDKAIATIESNLKYLDNTSDYNFLARLYYLNGEDARAIEALDKIKTKNWLSYLYLGLAHESLGDNKVAVKNYLKSIKLNENSIALYRLGKINYNEKKYTKAALFFSKLLSLDSSIRLANYYLAECYFKNGNYKKAYSYSSKSINFYPKNKNITDQLSQIKQKIGKAFFVEAKHALERARGLVKLIFYKREKNTPIINVGIAEGLKDFTFRCGENFTISDSRNAFNGKKDKFYQIAYLNNLICLKDADTDKVYREFTSPVFIKSEEYPFYVLDITYGNANFWHKKIDRIYRGDFKVLAEKDLTLINILSIEEYLYGVLPAEILVTSDREALKAQAIAARTLAFKSKERPRHKDYDVCADVHCQVYQGMSVESDSTNKAVDDTKGEVILYRSKPIEAIYHANCGGCLRPDVFSKTNYYAKGCDFVKQDCYITDYQEQNRLLRFPEAFCSHSRKANYRWQRVYDAEDFALIFGYKLSDLKSVMPVEKISCGAYKEVEIKTKKNTHKIKGDFYIRNYFDKLRSGNFKVDIKFSSKKEPMMLFFWGAGFGHGAGMCQDGAEYMAKKGYTYQEILRHYYPSTEIIKKY